MAKIKHTILFLIMGCFCGCASFSKKEKEVPLNTDIAMQPVLDKALQGVSFTKGDWVREGWWDMFGEEALNAFIETAMEHNPDLLAAEAHIGVARSFASSKRSFLFPDVGADAATNYQHISHHSLLRAPPSTVPAVVNQIDLALDFKYEFDFWGKNRKGYESALGKMRSSIAEKEQVKLVVTTSLVRAYLDYQFHAKEKEVQERIFEVNTNLSALTAMRVEAGLDDLIAFEGRQVDVKRIEIGLSKSDGNLDTDKNVMLLLMGQSPGDPLNITTLPNRSDAPFSLPEDLSIDLVARRPDLMASIWRVEAAAFDIGVAKTAFYPSINLHALAGLQSLSWSDLFAIDSFKAFLNPAIHLPIFTGGRLNAELDEKVAEYNVAVYDYRKTLLKAANDVANALVMIEARAKETREQKALMKRLEEQLSLEVERFENGISNYLMLLERKRAVLTASLKLLSLDHQKHLALLSLVKALGGGYEGCHVAERICK